MAMVGILTGAIIIYMAFFVGEISLKATDDGKVIEVFVTAGNVVNKGDKLLLIDIHEKKMVGGKIEEKISANIVRSTLNGKILSVQVEPGAVVKNGKDVLMVLIPAKWQLP